jgi:hypothetical protein
VNCEAAEGIRAGIRDHGAALIGDCDLSGFQGLPFVLSVTVPVTSVFAGCLPPSRGANPVCTGMRRKTSASSWRSDALWVIDAP